MLRFYCGDSIIGERDFLLRSTVALPERKEPETGPLDDISSPIVNPSPSENDFPLARLTYDNVPKRTWHVNQLAAYLHRT